VTPKPRLLNPPDKKALEAHRPLELDFDTPMDLERLRAAITITPDPGNFWLDGPYGADKAGRWRYVLMPWGGWEAGQTYTVTDVHRDDCYHGHLALWRTSGSAGPLDLPCKRFAAACGTDWC